MSSNRSTWKSPFESLQHDHDSDSESTNNQQPIPKNKEVKAKKHLNACHDCKDTNSHLKDLVTPNKLTPKPLALTLQIEDFLPPKFDVPTISPSGFKPPITSQAQGLTQTLLISTLATLLAISAFLNLKQRKKIKDLEDSLPALLHTPMHRENDDLKQYNSSFQNEVSTPRDEPTPVPSIQPQETEVENEDFKLYKESFKSETKPSTPISPKSSFRLSSEEMRQKAERAQIALQEEMARDGK
jgi:hypothetical protein